MIKAILFDFDDTLGNREVYAYDAYTEAVNNSVGSDDALLVESMVQSCMIYDQFGNTNKDYVDERIFKQYGVHLAKGEYCCFNEWWKHNLNRFATLFDGSKEVLLTLKKRGYKLGVITNGASVSQHGKLQNTGIEELFDVVVVSGDVGIRKPDVRIFELAAKKLNVSCSECVFVGDTFDKDILGASKAGMEPIFIYTHGMRKCMVPFTKISDIKELIELF